MSRKPRFQKFSRLFTIGYIALLILSHVSAIVSASNTPSADKKSADYDPAFVLQSHWQDPAAVQTHGPRIFAGVDAVVPESMVLSVPDASKQVSQGLWEWLADQELDASVNLTDIARKQWGASWRTKEPMSDRIAALQNMELNLDFNSEPFPPYLQSVLFWSSIVRIRKVNLFAVSPRFENLLDALSSPGDLRYLAHRLVAETGLTRQNLSSEKPVLALGDITFGFGRDLSLPVWLNGMTDLPPGVLHNLLLYRIAQYDPEKVIFSNQTVETTELSALRGDISELARLLKKAARPDVKRPTANIVLCQRASDAAFPAMIDPVMNALLASGYEVRVTLHELPPADLQYVIIGKGWKDRRFMAGLLRLMDRKASKFNGSIILHPMGEIKRSGDWEKIRDYFRIPKSEKGWMSMPAEIPTGGYKVAWRGAKIKSFDSGMTRIRSARVKSIIGEPILNHIYKAESFPVILASGRDYLINGNLLDIQSSYILSGLMNETLLGPTSAYVTTTPGFTAAFSPVETALKIKLPPLPPSSERRMLLYGGDGSKIKEEGLGSILSFETKLHPWELLFLYISPKKEPGVAKVAKPVKEYVDPERQEGYTSGMESTEMKPEPNQEQTPEEKPKKETKPDKKTKNPTAKKPSSSSSKASKKKVYR